jgi:exonuclease VII small subunit
MKGLRNKTRDLLYRYNIDLSKMVCLTNIAKLTRSCYSGKDILKVVRNFKNILRRKNKTIHRYEDNLIDKDIIISELNSLISNLEQGMILLEKTNKELAINNNLLIEKNNTLSDARLGLANEIEKLTTKNSRLTITNKSLVKDLSVIRENNNESLKKKLGECTNFISKLNSKIERLEKTNTALKREILTLKTKKKEI